MKILMVNKLYWPHVGGVEKAVRDLAIGLGDLQEDFKVGVLAANTSFKTVHQEIDGIPVTKVASLGRLRSAPLAPTFPFWLRKLKSDIYHFHFPSAPFELTYLMSNPPGRLVVTYHSDIIRQKFLLKLYAPFIRRFLAKADVVIASSPNMIKHSPYLSKVKEKCMAIPFGIDTEEFEPTAEVLAQASRMREKYGSPLVLFIGRLIYYKGVSFLVEAMKKISAQAIIVGTGPLEETLKTQAAELGISDRIHFVGQVTDDEISAYYHACDIFVLPSIERTEAFGLVQIEAHACGKPVVSTNLKTGVPYANLDGITGIVVPPRNTEALAQAINKLLDNNNLRKQLGEAGKKRVREEFTRETMTKKMLGVYKGLLDDGSRLSDDRS